MNAAFYIIKPKEKNPLFGYHTLADQNGNIILFETKEEAQKFLLGCGMTDKEIREDGILIEQIGIEYSNADGIQFREEVSCGNLKTRAVMKAARMYVEEKISEWRKTHYSDDMTDTSVMRELYRTSGFFNPSFTSDVSRMIADVYAEKGRREQG